MSTVTTTVPIRERLDAVQRRIDRAASIAGRSSAGVTLIAVTKTVALEGVREAILAGIHDFGENRVQDLVHRMAGAQDLGPCRWHLIGHLQRNKAKKAVRVGSIIHSVDSLELARLVGSEAALVGRTVDVFAQINISGERSKFGFSSSELIEHAGDLAMIPFLRWRGLMTIAPERAEQRELHSMFADLRVLRNTLTTKFDPATWDSLSMGMSNDFEIAVEEGATHVRVGRAIFGDRPAVPTGGYL